MLRCVVDKETRSASRREPLHAAAHSRFDCVVQARILRRSAHLSPQIENPRQARRGKFRSGEVFCFVFFSARDVARFFVNYFENFLIRIGVRSGTSVRGEGHTKSGSRYPSESPSGDSPIFVARRCRFFEVKCFLM